MKCRCGAPMIARELRDTDRGLVEVWGGCEGNSGHGGLAFKPAEPWEPGGPLTAWERSMVAHLGCLGPWGHRSCVPAVWIDELRVVGDAVTGSLGSVGLYWRVEVARRRASS